MNKQVKMDMAIGFLVALLARNNGGIALTMDELKKHWNEGFTYRVEGDRIRIQKS